MKKILLFSDVSVTFHLAELSYIREITLEELFGGKSKCKESFLRCCSVSSA